MAKRSRVATRQTEFKVFGPFKLQCHKGSTALDPIRSEQAVIADIRKRYPNDRLDEKGGCYVFAIRTGGRAARGGAYLPWYVGKAVRSALIDESLSSRNFAQHYVGVAAKTHGSPVLFWIAKAAPGMAKSLNVIEIGRMEKELIAWAAHRNRQLLNKHHNTALAFRIEGVPLTAQSHPRARRGPAAMLAKMLEV